MFRQIRLDGLTVLLRAQTDRKAVLLLHRAAVVLRVLLLPIQRAPRLNLHRLRVLRQPMLRHRHPFLIRAVLSPLVTPEAVPATALVVLPVLHLRPARALMLRPAPAVPGLVLLYLLLHLPAIPVLPVNRLRLAAQMTARIRLLLKPAALLPKRLKHLRRMACRMR